MAAEQTRNRSRANTTAPKSQQNRAKRPYQRSGLYALQHSLQAYADREGWLESLGELGAALKGLRDELLADLGGDGAVSAQQRMIVESVVKTHLLLESVDRFLLAQPSLVNKRRRSLFAVVKDRQQIADSLVRHLVALGLERRAKPVETLEGYLAGRKGA